MSLLFRKQMAKSPVTCLMEGLMKYVSDRDVEGLLSLNADCLPKASKQVTKQDFEPVSVHRQPTAAADGDTRIEQESLIEGSKEKDLPKNSPAVQRVAPRFISPHPLVTFDQVPTTYEVESSLVGVESATESASINGSYTGPAQSPAPQVQTEAPAETLRPVSLSSFGMSHVVAVNGTALWLTLSRHPLSKESQPSQPSEPFP